MLTDANSAGNVFHEKSKFSASSKPKFSVSIMVEELKEQPPDDNNKEININNGENSAATTKTATTAATTDED